jgi:hypothetical protein
MEMFWNGAKIGMLKKATIFQIQRDRNQKLPVFCAAVLLITTPHLQNLRAEATILQQAEAILWALGWLGPNNYY